MGDQLDMHRREWGGLGKLKVWVGWLDEGRVCRRSGIAWWVMEGCWAFTWRQGAGRRVTIGERCVRHVFGGGRADWAWLGVAGSL